MIEIFEELQKIHHIDISKGACESFVVTIILVILGKSTSLETPIQMYHQASITAQDNSTK